ncbi:hypothetical protein A2Z33_01680 [Candidatus Gottesmanbacteria bacterium RBG_16_52_11]|uniref:EamA domain-containing protein n=1 Tax=Candidatus Gottesmanbacteria bacterium RBG_16_52_11 TaxID=1798374 RepID=A0A1F5YNY4_9BACT|nr:MAG: hypothetical protein A2Z33_01680 [Candidatus Gottesmanbacteria bacterium RBG_16_52_11]
MNWFGFAIATVILNTIYSILSRVLSVRSCDPRVFTALYNMTGGLMALGLWLVYPEPLKIPDFRTGAITLLAILSWTLFSRLEFITRKKVEASVLTIVMRIGYAIPFAAAIIFFGEPLTNSKIAAMGIIVCANWLIISARFRKSEVESFRRPLMMAGALGLGWTLDKVATAHYPTQFYTFLMFFIPGLVNGLTPPMTLRTVRLELATASWNMPLLALINIASYMLLMKAFIFGEASSVVLVSSTYYVFAVVAAVILLKETTHLWRKILAGILVFSAVIILT